MQNRTFFPVSVGIRLLLAMLLPIQIMLSSGVAGTYLSGFGIVWTLVDGFFQIHFLSIIIATVYAIPAILFCIYFKFKIKEAYPIKTAFFASTLIFVVPLVGMLIPIDTTISDYNPLMPVSVGYSVGLFLGFVLIPSLRFLVISSGNTIYSLEFVFSSVALLAVIAIPFVLFYSHGVYASDQTLLSSIFITKSYARSGWITESGFYYLHPTSLSELDILFASFFVVLILRIGFLCFVIACFLGKTSVTRTCFVGLVYEGLLIISAYLLNASIPISPYVSSGTIPLPILFPSLLLMILVHKRIREPKSKREEEFVTVPILSRLKYQVKMLKNKLSDRKEP
ncbi:MAG: hypothetical protein P1Q69_00190 [Candidatus Thorarchaeota archaeon]|nr:hypothetical protein [Candidatus Thorarchaeota archaeon]